MEIRPLPFTAYPTRWKRILLLLVALSFVAVGVFLVQGRSTMFWLSTGFFSLCALVFLVQLAPGSSYLTVDDEGIEFCALFRKSRIRWSDLSAFGVYQQRFSKFVGFDFAPDYAAGASGRAVAKSLTGFEGALPDTYGFRAEDLAELLAYHRAQRTTT